MPTGECCFLVRAVQMQRHEEWVLTIKEGYVPKPHGRGLWAECKDVKVSLKGEQKMRVPVRSYEAKALPHYLLPKIRGLLLCVSTEEEIFETGDDIESRSC